jgi:hypothetical protein
VGIPKRSACLKHGNPALPSRLDQFRQLTGLINQDPTDEMRKLHTLKRNLLIGVLAVVILFSFIFFYLKASSPLSEDKFIDIYIQLSIAHEKYQNDSSKLQQEKKQILKHFKATQKDIENFIKTYQRNPEKWAGVWEKVNSKLEKLSQSK